MPRELTITCKGRRRDPALPLLYGLVWAGHAVLLAALLRFPWLGGDEEAWLAWIWCVLVVLALPLAFFLMSRPQMLAATERGLEIHGTGLPFPRSRRVRRDRVLRLNRMSCCWGACELLILHWGRWPWQSVLLAPLAHSDEKRAIAAVVADFLREQRFDLRPDDTGRPRGV